METRGVYDIVLRELDAGEMTEIEARVFDALKKYPRGVTRPQLVAMVFGQTTKNEMTNNNTKDRKVRLAIASLRSRMVPIMSSSGEAGYRLDNSPAARRRMVMDLISRRDKLTDLINRMAHVLEIPAEVPGMENARQQKLL